MVLSGTETIGHEMFILDHRIFKQFMMFHSIVKKLVIFLRLYQIYWQEQSIRYLIWIWNQFRQISHGDKYLSLVLILENHWASKCLVLFNKTSFLLLFNAIQAVIYNIFKQKLEYLVTSTCHWYPSEPLSFKMSSAFQQKLFLIAFQCNSSSIILYCLAETRIPGDKYLSLVSLRTIGLQNI